MYMHIPNNTTSSYFIQTNKMFTNFNPTDKQEICWLFVIALMFGAVSIVEAVTTKEVVYDSKGLVVLDEKGVVIKQTKNIGLVVIRIVLAIAFIFIMYHLCFSRKNESGTKSGNKEE